jgi:hypothetical protein
MKPQHMTEKTIIFETDAQWAAFGDVLSALGVPDAEQGDDAKLVAAIDKFSMEDIATMINFALKLQTLDRPGLRTRLLDYWSTGNGAFKGHQQAIATR